MAGIVETILLNIQASVSGAAGIAGLTGGISGLTNKLLGLNQGLQIVQQVTSAVNGMVNQLEDWADAANKAATDTRVFQLTLARFGVSVDEAGGAAQRLADKFGLSVQEVQGSMTTLIRAGFRDMGQLEQVMTGAAASAVAFGRTASEGFDRIGDAAVTGLSAALNSIGIAENLGPALDKYAASLDKTADALTDVERAQALANLVTKATGVEVEALGEIQNDYVKSQQASKLASDNLSRALGEITMPIVIRYKQATADLTNTVIEGIRAYQQGGDALKVLTDKYPQLGRGLSQLKPVAEEMKRGLLDAWGGITDFAERVLLPAFEQIRPVAERVWRYIPPLIESAGRLIGETFKLIADLWQNVLKPVWDALAPVVEYAVTGALSFLKEGFDFISGIFTSIRALIHGDWRGAWGTFSETVSKAWDRINEILEGLGTSIRTALFKLADTAKERGRVFGENLRDSIVAGVAGLAEQLTDRMTDAIEKMTAKLPQWFKDRFGITAVVETLEGNADAAGQRAADARAGIAGRAPTIDPSTLNEFSASIFEQAFKQRGDKLADNFVDYCLRWVRDELGDAAPEFRNQLNKLFQSNPEIYTDANGKTSKTPTARSAYGNFQAAGLTRDYKTFADLKVGDTVFYVDGGQNHVGTYIGNGQVRGNNRVSYQESGGKDPVGTVDINRLGKVTGYVAATELLAYLNGNTPVTGQPKAGTPANVPTVKPPASPADTTDQGGPFTAQQYAEALKRLKAIETAQKALQSDKDNVALANSLIAAQAASEKFAKSSLSAADAVKAAQTAMSGAKKTTDAYIATQADFNNYSREALLLIKEQERVNKSGTAAEREAVRGRVLAFAEQGKAQAAVLDAERAAYQSRQQLSEKEKQDEVARAQVMAGIARDAAAGREAEARRGLDSLKRAQAEALDLAEDDAGKRAQVIDSSGPQILAAEALIARRVREQAVRAANDAAAERLKVEGANGAEIEKARRAAVAEAYRVEKEAGTVARGEQRRAERGASKTAAEEQKQLAAELAGLKIDSAKATAGRLKLLADEEFRNAEGDAQRQLELVRKSSQAEFDRAQQIAQATRRLAYEDAAGKPNEQALRDKAQADYRATVEQARITRLGQVKTAQDAVTKSLDEGTRAGNAALDSLEKLNLGGRDLVNTAQKLPDTRAQYDTLFARIVALRDELTDPSVVDAWTQSIQEMGTAGQLSAVQVQTLLNIVKDLSGARDVQVGDNLQGRGVVREAATNDASQGTLAQGEAERLAAAMIGMDPEELGGILAGLVAKGFGESDLAQLIRGQIVTMNFDDLAQMVTDANGPRFQTDNEVRGIGVPAENATEAYLNLESVIQDIGQFSLSELDKLISQTGLGADEAERLYTAWAAVYGEFEKGAGGSDATSGPGKGLLNNARPDDASQGTLAPGEADRLLEAMVGIDPKELGGILADLVARGFGESDLARLIRGQIQSSAEAIDASLREFGGVGVDVNTGEQTFLTDDEVRGIGQRSENAQDAFIDLEAVIETVMTLSREEMDALLAKTDLLPDQIKKVTAAWEDLHGTLESANIATLDEQLDPIAVNLQSVFDRLQSGASTAGEARQDFALLRAQLEGIGGEAAQNLIAVIDDAIRGFDSLGSVSADVTAALAKVRKEAELPYDGLIRKLQQMRTEPGAAVVEIDALIASLQKLNGVAAKEQGIEKMTAKINEFADYARRAIPLVTSAFQALGGMSGEVADAWGDSLGRMVNDVVSFATAIARGDYIGAAIQALTSIFTFFTRQAEEARAELKKTMDYSKQFRFDNGDGYGTRKTTSTTTGFLFWQKTVVTEQIDEVGKQMALSFENAVVNGVGSGLAEAVAKNDSSILEKSILTNLKNAALQGLTEAFLSSATVAGVIGPLVQNLIAAFRTGNTENIRAAVADFREGVRGLKSEMDGLVEAGKILSDELGDAGESFSSTFSDSIRSGVRALLSGQSPLQALYDDVRGKIESAVINGFFVQAALDKLQPFLDALKAKLDAGMDPTQAIAQIGAQLPGISAQLQLELGPLVAALNTYLPNALNANTAALNGNTAALRESQFQTTYAVSYADVRPNSTVRQQLAGL